MVYQWFKNGDHPEDGETGEGDIVRYYRNPDIGDAGICPHCGDIAINHGWIDVPPNGRTVCPGDWIIKRYPADYYPMKDDLYQILFRKNKQEGF